MYWYTILIVLKLRSKGTKAVFVKLFLFQSGRFLAEGSLFGTLLAGFEVYIHDDHNFFLVMLVGVIHVSVNQINIFKSVTSYLLIKLI